MVWTNSVRFTTSDSVAPTRKGGYPQPQRSHNADSRFVSARRPRAMAPFKGGGTTRRTVDRHKLVDEREGELRAVRLVQLHLRRLAQHFQQLSQLCVRTLVRGRLHPTLAASSTSVRSCQRAHARGPATAQPARALPRTTSSRLSSSRPWAAKSSSDEM